MTRFRKEVIGEATLLLGDCRELLETVGPVDVVLTDPPYSDNTHRMAKTNRGAGHGVKLVTFEALSDEAFVAAVERCLAVTSAWVILTCDYRHAALFYGHPAFVRLGAWVKPNPMPQISADRPGQGFETVLILHGPGPKVWNRGGGAGVWTFPVVNGADVPTQKPLALLQALVSDFTHPGAHVLDPFMGSGTTGVACALAGRGFVGIEADPCRFEIACRRIEEAHRQPRLFAEPTPRAEQAAFTFDAPLNEALPTDDAVRVTTTNNMAGPEPT